MRRSDALKRATVIGTIKGKDGKDLEVVTPPRDRIDRPQIKGDAKPTVRG